MAHPSARREAKSGTFGEKLGENGGPVAHSGQAAPAGPTPRAGNSHPVGRRHSPPPNSNHRHFHRFPSPAAAPKGPAFGRLEKPGQPPAGLRPAGGLRPKAEGWPKAFGLRPKAGRRPGPKKGTFFATLSLSVTCDHKFRDCHSDEETILFFATRGSVQRSATAQSAEATVGRKKSERSPERQPRVQKSRKKSSFLSKSSGKIGGK